MHHEAANKALLTIDVPWDDVRSARVHKRALEAFRNANEEADEALAAAEDALPKARARRWSLWMAVAAIVTTVGALLVFVRFAGQRADQAGVAWPAVSTVAYADGSRSLLSEHAQVEVIEDRQEQVRVRQSAGNVRYEIVPRSERTFEVGVMGVSVKVLGTVFEVSVSGDKVVVAVDHGRVRVQHGERKLELTDGERVTIDVGSADDRGWGGPAADAKGATGDGKAGEPDAQTQVAPGNEPSPTEREPDAAELMRRADAARTGGRLDEAAQALRELVNRHPGDGRVVLALYSLGKVERRRGNHGAAAQAFESCGLALKGDALAEAASSWAAAGQSERARAAARRYLGAFPQGVHASGMGTLAGSH